MRKRRVVGRIYGMEYSWKGHTDRNRHKNRIKRSRQARLVYVTDINRNIPTTWRWTRGDPANRSTWLMWPGEKRGPHQNHYFNLALLRSERGQQLGSSTRERNAWISRLKRLVTKQQARTTGCLPELAFSKRVFCKTADILSRRLKRVKIITQK